MKSTAELRNFLSSQMVKLSKGDQDVKCAKAVCNYAAQIYNTLNLEVKVEQMRRKVESQPIKAITFPVAGGDK